MYKFGLKLWSINENYIKDAKKLYEKGVYNYIELFAVPNSYKKFINLWKDLDIPFIIHAAHSAKGLNLAKKEFLSDNLKLAQEAFKFADDLNAETIIFHPGVDGDIKETVRQLNKIIDSRIVVENKPYYGIYDNVICNGHSPEEIKFVMENTGVGFCLDLGHAIYSANTKKIGPFLYIKEFLKLNPKMFHISDGDMNGVYDEHKNIGKGSFDIKTILSLVPEDSYISVETNKNFKSSLKDFEQDVARLREMERENNEVKNFSCM